ncbi:MAG: hypothetical protein ACREIT_06450, partial [Tepidisphaeraceae bacterium]
TQDRFELNRRSGRHLDLSHAIAAAALVVLAQADDQPLPYPLEVEGNVVTGSGTTLYEFVIPLDRGDLDTRAEPSPATQPTVRSPLPLTNWQFAIGNLQFAIANTAVAERSPLQIANCKLPIAN